MAVVNGSLYSSISAIRASICREGQRPYIPGRLYAKKSAPQGVQAPRSPNVIVRHKTKSICRKGRLLVEEILLTNLPARI